MDELEVLRVRDEVLQAMYWMHSEAIATEPDAKELSRFLAVPESLLTAYLDRFVEDGLLERNARANGNGNGHAFYQLSPTGMESGKRTFADEMADLTRPTHGECDEDCWCHDSPEAAAECLHAKAGHSHSS
jgi:DNA-binding PadR family transcriptional regulator